MIHIISGPTNVGKTTLKLELKKRVLPKTHFPVSCTTRAREADERDGFDYKFLSREIFSRRVELGLFAEWAEVYGNLYGTMEFDLSRYGEVSIITELDFQGMRHIRESYPEVQTIFILPPSIEALEERIRKGRRGESEDGIKRRLERAQMEILLAHEYDHQVVNEDFSFALESLIRLIGQSVAV